MLTFDLPELHPLQNNNSVLRRTPFFGLEFSELLSLLLLEILLDGKD